MEEQRGKMSVQEAGRLGGAARKAEMTPEAYAEIGRKGGSTTQDSYGKAHYAALRQSNERFAHGFQQECFQAASPGRTRPDLRHQLVEALL
jgi:general stress protein YciG